MVNYVITHYTGNLDQPGIRAFVQSTALVKAEVLFFTSNTEVPDSLKAPNIHWILVPRKVEPNLQRHYDFLNFLEAEKPMGKFFICDCRDLVFLGDPFQNLSGHEHLHVFQECGLFRNRDEYYNMRWLEMMYPGALDVLGDFPILCGGTILAECREIAEAYLRAHTASITRHLPNRTVELSDQATFQEVARFYTDPTTLITHTNEEPSLVYTMGNVPDDEYAIRDGRIWVGPYCPAVIHQFDRRYRAFKFISETYPHWPQFPNA
mgnify:CR=1 FL=1